jgi:hypothetical protein
VLGSQRIDCAQSHEACEVSARDDWIDAWRSARREESGEAGCCYRGPLDSMAGQLLGLRNDMAQWDEHVAAGLRDASPRTRAYGIVVRALQSRGWAGHAIVGLLRNPDGWRRGLAALRRMREELA